MIDVIQPIINLLNSIIKEYEDRVLTIEDSINDNTISKEVIGNIGLDSRKYYQYKKLLRKIEDTNNPSFITELDLLDRLFKDKEVDIDTKNNYLLQVMKYNQEVEKVGVKEKKDYTIDDYVRVFNNYKYDFYRLDKKYQDLLFTYGDIDNISEIFDCLEKYNYPLLELPKNSFLLTILLVNCTKDIFSIISEFSISRGLVSRDVISIFPCLVSNMELEDENSINILDNNHVIIAGRSDDYLKNVLFLEELGFNIKDVYQKSRELLIINNEMLVNNYLAFNDYKLDNSFNSLMISCLLNNSFREILDQFIESCREGYNYIKNNLKYIGNITSYDDIIFFNIYASYMMENEYGVPLLSEGPFIRKNSKNPVLRGEITRFAGSGYEKIPYREIEDDNKWDKTMTIDLPIKNKEKFISTIKKSLEDKLILRNRELDDELLHLEEYVFDNDISYRIGEVIISKNKVIRIWNILKYYGVEKEEDSLLFAVTYNSIMNEETFRKVKECLSKKVNC